MQKWLKGIAVIVFGVVAYLTLFYELGDSTLQLWDEARLANNTLEMLDNGNLLVTYYDGEPDLWNTKPPFLIWVQSISASVFGLSVWAIRLPSAIAGLLTALVLWFFCSKILKNWWMGFFSALALVVYPLFVTDHVTRSADYDAMLILFTTIHVLAFYTFIVLKSNKYLYLSAVALTLGILTKGIAAVLFLPFMGIWLLLNKEVLHLLKNKHFYYSLSIVLVVGVGYYFLREAINPGYLEAVANNELGGRFSEAIEGHRGEWWFYLQLLYMDVYMVTIPALAGLVMMLFYHAKQASYWLLLCLGVVLVLSVAETKIAWYLALIYPLVMLGFGYLISQLLHVKQAVLKVIPLLAAGFVIASYGMYTVDENLTQKGYRSPDIAYENYIKSIPEYRNYKLVSNMYYNGHTAFYAKLYNKQGYNLQQAKSEEVTSGDTLMLCEPDVKMEIKNEYNYQLLDSGESCILVRINNKLD